MPNAIADIPAVLLAASKGSFLIKPGIGLMIWTLVVFVVTMLLLRRYAFPAISQALGKRQKAIEDSIDTAERTRTEADKLLAEYRERLKEARAQADEIVQRALSDIRREVADLTVLATEKVTRKSLTDEDQRRLVEEALAELDFSSIS